jgi:tetratricopeptide (TPR) repeat protein
MGEVWEAFDHALQRRVALKLLPGGSLAAATDQSRFAREAEACARVRHENVVAIYKTGSAEGLAYIAEELVPGGRTLRDEIEEARRGNAPARSYRDIAQLVVRVADALAAVHAAGVVHRDVKPQNVLIAPDGAPKVADFGLALLEGGLSLSRSGDFLGTYFYASPEQVRPDGSRVDARSDVFSLGATLYECLTWRRPFDGDSVQAVAHAITREEPVDPRRVRPSVPADLAVIALKALEKGRASRYASMGDLAEDLRAYLAHEPIRARPPSPARRAQKWARRHPTASVSIALSALAFAALLALFLRSERLREAAEAARAKERESSASLARANADLRASQAEATRQAQAARLEAAVSGEVEGFLTGLFESADPRLYGREELTLRDVVVRGGERLLAGEVETPEVRARLATTLGSLLATLGEYGASRELLDGAAEVWRELGRETDPAAQETKAALAVAAMDAGLDPEALALLDELDGERRAGRLEPELAFEVARMRGPLLVRLGRFEEAEAALREAEELVQGVLPEDHEARVLVRLRLGEVLRNQGRYAELESLLAEDARRLDSVLDSGNTLALDLFNLLGIARLHEQRLDEANALLTRVAQAAERSLGADHVRSINYRGNLATALEQQGELGQAEVLHRAGLEALERRYGRTSPEACATRNNLAMCLCRQGRASEAEPILRELLADMESTQGPTHLLTTRARTSLASCVYLLGRPGEAAALIEQALVDLPATAAERPPLEEGLARIRAQIGGG